MKRPSEKEERKNNTEFLFYHSLLILYTCMYIPRYMYHYHIIICVPVHRLTKKCFFLVMTREWLFAAILEIKNGSSWKASSRVPSSMCNKTFTPHLCPATASHTSTSLTVLHGCVKLPELIQHTCTYTCTVELTMYITYIHTYMYRYPGT